jgi:hypothetical protein
MPMYIGDFADKSDALSFVFHRVKCRKSIIFVIQNSASHLWTVTIFTFIPVIYVLALFEIPESPTYLNKRVGKMRLRTSYNTSKVFVILSRKNLRKQKNNT